MLKVEVDSYRAITRFERMGANIQQEIIKTSILLTAMLRSYIIQDKISGQLVNHITGKLWQSMYEIEPTVSGDSVTAGVGQSAAIAPYGRYLEDGTSPYDIFPKDAKALHFFIGANEIFAKIVHHPGIAARNYMSSSLTDKQQYIAEEYTAAFMRGANEQ